MFELFLFTATPIVACITLLLKAFSTTGLKRKLVLFLISSAMAGFSFAFIYLNFVHIPDHYYCKAELEGEASKVSAAIASYFSEPSRTQIPSISDLINSEDYVLLENRDSKYKKLVEESEFSIAIVDGDVNEIPIVVSSKEGRCPFQKGECSWSKGEVFVLTYGSSQFPVWLSSYEEK